ncbi:UDP-N-acetylglucosamine--N-acetylmuramyl-(pentapeptide) pyrophosphoryl-undecaprenol N-acetylglucosaminetransferase [Striga asiatica]|uniref:UDP-N-acetylglucosamine--N-acetylmuramyl-(Pentapeptide) pyrophosphoryl-undecaprenol N-acetylglucosaminetransferase n=1 Tax=Striga asiatica TaxID=4170 RepID=A0A5A7PGN9_STRAF|nr:UDP-N-acetylglucosamine--N-acetylmuramyl-(pentapeptide) pyrophosphoryl-undecaprenol N-acetylglucosaminetransferase [Striga asiatica]
MEASDIGKVVGNVFAGRALGFSWFFDREAIQDRVPDFPAKYEGKTIERALHRNNLKKKLILPATLLVVEPIYQVLNVEAATEVVEGPAATTEPVVEADSQVTVDQVIAEPTSDQAVVEGSSASPS